jgi:metal-dependent amidase/aminoacylase/carboxypeptidase family protein
VNLEDVAAQAVAWRQHLHAHPELAFDEHETARFVCETLVSFGRPCLPTPSPHFTIDERALPVGIETLTRAALRFLADGAAE